MPHHHRPRPSHSSHGSFVSPPTGLTDLARCSTAFLPSDPARTGRVAFWRPDGTGAPDLPAATDPGAVGEPTVAVGPDGDTRTIEALLVPTATALPLLTRARLAPGASPSTAFWDAAALLALRIAADGKLLPDLSGTDHDAWRAGPLTAEEQERVRMLAAAMPAVAHSVPLGTAPPRSLLLPARERLLRSFVDAVVDGLPRTPAAPLVAAGPAFAAAPVRRPSPAHLAVVRDWVADVSATTESGVRLSLRIEVSGLTTAECAAEDRPRRSRAEDAPATARPPGPAFRAVLQMHSVIDPSVVSDAADAWSGAATGTAFGPHARRDALLALRRAARVWPALGPLLSAAVPDAVDLADDEITELLGPASEALGALGVQVHWPGNWSVRSRPAPSSARLPAHPGHTSQATRRSRSRHLARPTRRTRNPPIRRAPRGGQHPELICPRSSRPTPCSPSTGSSRWATTGSAAPSWTGSQRPAGLWCACGTSGCSSIPRRPGAPVTRRTGARTARSPRSPRSAPS